MYIYIFYPHKPCNTPSYPLYRDSRSTSARQLFLGGSGQLTSNEKGYIGSLLKESWGYMVFLWPNDDCTELQSNDEPLNPVIWSHLGYKVPTMLVILTLSLQVVISACAIQAPYLLHTKLWSRPSTGRCFRNRTDVLLDASENRFLKTL